MEHVVYGVRGVELGGCRGKDFLRQIVNRVIVEASGKIPVNVIEDLKTRFARAEDKFGFSSFGGDPGRLVNFLSSEDWADLVEYAKNLNALWIIEAILKRLKEEYEDTCPQVASKAGEVLEGLSRGVTVTGEELTLDAIVRRLKFHGLKVEVKKEGGREYAIVEQPLVKLKLYVSEGKISYEVCKEGKASTVDAVIAVLQKVREL